jgi:uncharacterized membrane protein YbaN (DUF454 family)
MTRYWKLKKEVLDCTLRRSCFGGGCGAVVRDYIMNEMLDRFCNHLILREIFNSCFQKWQRRGKSEEPEATICLHSFMHMIVIILSLYRVPTGYFNQFIKNLGDALKHLYKSKPELLIHGYINIDYLIVSK